MSDSEDDEDVIEFDEAPWEEQARRAIESAAATIQKDEIRGVIYMRTGVDADFFPSQQEFASWEDVRRRLSDVGEREWTNYVPFEGGEPVFQPNVDALVGGAMSSYGIEDFFDSISSPKEGEQLANAHDLVAHRAGLVVQVDLAEINSELVRYLAEHPEKMYDLNPRKFEELVAELFRAKGYDVELGPGRKDGGVDIRAFLRSDIGALLTLIQCKRYGPTHRINVDAVRQMYGVLHRDKATAGIIVTTSTFTRDARSEQQQLEHRIHLAEYDDVTRWLRDYPRQGKTR